MPQRAACEPLIAGTVYIALINALLCNLRGNVDAIESFVAGIDAIGLVSLFLSCSALYNQWIRDADHYFDIARLALDHFYGYLKGLKVTDRRDRRRYVIVGSGPRAFSLLQHLAVGKDALHRSVLNCANRVLDACGTMSMLSTEFVINSMYDFRFGNVPPSTHVGFPSTAVGHFDVSFGLARDHMRGAKYDDHEFDNEVTVFFTTPAEWLDPFTVTATRQQDHFGVDRFYGVVRRCCDNSTLYIIGIDMAKLYRAVNPTGSDDPHSHNYEFDVDMSAVDANYDWIGIRKIVLPPICVDNADDMENFWLAGNYLAQRTDERTVVTVDIESGQMFTSAFGGTGRLSFRELADKPENACEDAAFFVNEPCFVYDQQFARQKTRRLHKKLLLPFPTAASFC